MSGGYILNDGLYIASPVTGQLFKIGFIPPVFSNVESVVGISGSRNRPILAIEMGIIVNAQNVTGLKHVVITMQFI